VAKHAWGAARVSELLDQLDSEVELNGRQKLLITRTNLIGSLSGSKARVFFRRISAQALILSKKLIDCVGARVFVGGVCFVGQAARGMACLSSQGDSQCCGLE
jgi:hypothetical protein